MEKVIARYFVAGLILCSAMIVGCEGTEVDLTPPTMEQPSFVPSPVEAEICGTIDPTVFILNGGDELSFDVLFADDVALSQYKVDIHNNFDCHGHGGGSAPSVAVPDVASQTTDWSVLQIEDLSGTSEQVVWTATVPENVTAGNYHYHIQVIDESGNDSPFSTFYSLKITNPLDNIAPQISVDQPVVREMTMERGESIRFVGQVTDNRSLSDGGNGVLYLAYTDLSSGNTFNTNTSFPFSAEVGQSFDFDFEYEIPSSLVSGDYRLSLGANDGVRNVAPFVFFDVKVD